MELYQIYHIAEKGHTRTVTRHSFIEPHPGVFLNLGYFIKQTTDVTDISMVINRYYRGEGHVAISPEAHSIIKKGVAWTLGSIDDIPPFFTPTVQDFRNRLHGSTDLVRGFVTEDFCARLPLWSSPRRMLIHTEVRVHGPSLIYAIPKAIIASGLKLTGMAEEWAHNQVA